MTATPMSTGVKLTLLAVILALVGLDVAVLTKGNRTTTTTRVVTRTVTVAPDLSAQVGAAGLVAADRQYMTAQDALSRRRNVPTWTMGYQIAAADPNSARVLNWVLTLDGRQPQWSAVTVSLRWSNGRWVSEGVTFIQPLGGTPSDYDKFQPFA